MPEPLETPWAKCIVPRLDYLESLFVDINFKSSIIDYLESVRASLRQKFENMPKANEEFDMIRGKILFINEFLELPEQLKRVKAEMKKREGLNPHGLE